MIRLCRECAARMKALGIERNYSPTAYKELCDECGLTNLLPSSTLTSVRKDNVVNIETAKATKADNGKPKLSLLTRESLVAEARAFEYGARKYDKNNYKKGMEWSRVIDAAYRHLAAFNAKEPFDNESKLSHLDHLKACVAMLVYYEANKIGTDDR